MRKYSLNQFVNDRENISIKCMNNDMTCSVHTHEFVELIFIAEGSCEHCIDGVSYQAEAGDLLFVNYNQTHAFTARSPKYQYYNLLYVPGFFSEELINSENIYDIFEISLFREFEDSRTDTSQLVQFRGNDFGEVKKLVEDMNAEFQQKELGYRSILNGYSRVLFSKILRKLKTRSSDDETQKYINRITADCLDYINQNCFEHIKLQEIAEQSFYHPSYFSRVFKEQFGVNFTEYIKEKRINEAARLLTDLDLTVEEIMRQVGYTDKNRFYKHFREIYHQTPAAFRKSQKR